MNKKLLLITIFLIFCVSTLFAEPIVVKGYGNTYEEATNDSLAELSAFISTEVSSVTRSSLLVEGDEVTKNSFSDDLILFSFSELIGVEYEQKQDVDGLKCVEATIPDSESVIVQYKGHIKDILDEIDETRLLLENSSNDYDKLQYLEFIFSYIKMFKNYKFILLHLNVSWISPQLSVSETALKVQYLTLLNKQQSLLDDEIAKLQLVLSEKEQQQSDKLNFIIAQRDEIKANREKAIADEEKWRQGIRNSKTVEIINKADGLKAKSLKRKAKDVTLLIPSKNPLAIIDQIESKFVSYENSCGRLLEEIKILRLQIEEDFLIDKEKISKRKISIAEKVNDKETPHSKQHTQYLIQESNTSHFKQYQEHRATLLAAVKDDLSNEYETLLSNIKELNETGFIIDSRQDDVNITIGQYNGINNSWPVVVDFSILDKRIEMEYELSYEDFTQTKIPSIEEGGAYPPEFVEYIDQVEVLEAYFADLESEPISIQLQYSVLSDKGSIHNYFINVNKIIVTRNDNNKQIIKANLSPTNIDDFNYSIQDNLVLYSLIEKLGFHEYELMLSNLTLIREWDFGPFVVTFINTLEENEVSIIRNVFNGSKVIPPEIHKDIGYKFVGWYKVNESSKRWKFDEDIVAENLILHAKWEEKSVGDNGPAGGLIFYDKGKYSDGWRYLEAAPYGWYNGEDDPRFQWGARGKYNDYSVLTANEIGSGASNTVNIIALHDNLQNDYPEKGDYYTNPKKYDINNDGTVAAKVCTDYSIEVDGVIYDDWFLPSKDELNLIDENLYKQGLGGFFSKTDIRLERHYWSSSNCLVDWAYCQSFVHGGLEFNSKTCNYRVRPIRAF